MEASGTPSPAAQPPPPPPPTTTATGDDGKAGWGWRILALVLGLVLAFGVALMVLFPVNPDNTPLCEQAAPGVDCFDLTETQNTVQNVVATITAAVGTLAILAALFFVFTGRRGDLLLRLTAAAVVLGVIVFLIGQF